MAVARNSILALLLLVGLASPRAQAGVEPLNFSLMGGINNTFGASGSLGIAGGVALEFWVGPYFGVEADWLFVSRSFKGASNINYAQIPVLLRTSFVPFFSIGFGAFYDIPITTGANTNDGLVTDLRFKAPGFPLFLDTRFDIGLKSSAMGTGTSLYDLQVLAGFMF